MAEVTIISLLTTTVEYIPFQIINSFFFFFSMFLCLHLYSLTQPTHLVDSALPHPGERRQENVKLWLLHRAEHRLLPSCKFACIPDFTRLIILLYCINFIRWLFYCSNVAILLFDVKTYLKETKPTCRSHQQCVEVDACMNDNTITEHLLAFFFSLQTSKICHAYYTRSKICIYWSLQQS